MAKTETPVFIGTGRRKTSVARVRVREGKGKIEINKRSLEEFFPNKRDQNDVLVALETTGVRETVNVWIRVHGGGSSGQSGACKLGIARALIRFNEELEPALRENNMLTRDSRMKERKKPGLHGARRGQQFSKR